MTQAKAQAIQYTRRKAGLFFEYMTQGDFRYCVGKIRIVKRDSGWAVLTCEANAFAFCTYFAGFRTVSQAKSYVNMFLA